VSDIVFALGLAAKIPVLLAAWTPTGVSMIFGASMLLHLEDGLGEVFDLTRWANDILTIG